MANNHWASFTFTALPRAPMTEKDMPTSRLAKLAALFEVVFVFALLHFTYQALKHFIALGSVEASVGLNLRRE